MNTSYNCFYIAAFHVDGNFTFHCIAGYAQSCEVFEPRTVFHGYGCRIKFFIGSIVLCVLITCCRADDAIATIRCAGVCAVHEVRG